MAPKLNNRGFTAFHELEKPSDGRLSEQRIEKHLEGRVPLWKAALSAAMEAKETIARKLYQGHGVWWPELAPLTGAERGEILKQLRHMWSIPERSSS